MDDVVMFKSGFASTIISMILNKLLKKAGFTGSTIQLSSFYLEHSENGKIKIRANVSVDASEHDFYKLIKME